MSRLGAGHVWLRHMESGQNPIYVQFFGKFGLEKVFDDLHFTNSPNASPLIVHSF
jgi:hypothetical protein